MSNIYPVRFMYYKYAVKVFLGHILYDWYFPRFILEQYQAYVFAVFQKGHSPNLGRKIFSLTLSLYLGLIYACGSCGKKHERTTSLPDISTNGKPVALIQLVTALKYRECYQPFKSTGIIHFNPLPDGLTNNSSVSKYS